MCEALASGRERARESLQSCKEGKIVGFSLVEGQGISPIGCCTFLPAPARAPARWRRSPTSDLLRVPGIQAARWEGSRQGMSGRGGPGAGSKGI